MSLFRYDPPTGSPIIEGFAREAAGGPVVCRTCGCRLQGPGSTMDADGSSGAWRHFEGLPGRDARGCTVGCVEAAHGPDGVVLA